MSDYDNVVPGKLSLKGKALAIKDGKKVKKKKQSGMNERQLRAVAEAQEALRREEAGETDEGEGREDGEGNEGAAQGNTAEDHRTPAERRYLEQLAALELKKATKLAKKSHREKIEDFNNYLANMTEHYDIPKVGPG